VREITGGN